LICIVMLFEKEGLVTLRIYIHGAHTKKRQFFPTGPGQFTTFLRAEL